MITVHHHPPAVQSETFADDWPSIEPEPFHPSLADELGDLGYRLGLDGEASARPPRGTPGDACLRFLRGLHDGRIAREAAEARELGRHMGYTMGASEPPAGLAPHEKAAYRDGFAAGVLEDSRDFEAWVSEMEDARRDAAFGDLGISDADMYPMGCAS